MTLWSDGKTNEDIQKLAETNSDSVVYNLHEDLLYVKEQLAKANERVKELEVLAEERAEFIINASNMARRGTSPHNSTILSNTSGGLAL